MFMAPPKNNLIELNHDFQRIATVGEIKRIRP